MKVAVGDFIEYQASFSPSELVTVMDVLTPDLVAQITAWLAKHKEIAGFDGYGSFEKVQIAALRMNEQAKANADLARDVAIGVQADFRQDKTREYYGLVGEDDPFTAITICDNSHFVVEDEDRILDGTFTVLGKITSGPAEDVPVLQRNKLLRNISADGVDALFAQLKSSMKGQTFKIGETSIDDLLDIKLSSRIRGTSIRVLPIAIYV
jgi:hypothetical protein